MKDFSVIIPAYNEEALIAKAVQSLKEQDYPGSLEIIVVDNNSSDMTAAEASGADRVLFYDEMQNGAAARHYGVLNSQGDYIATLDGDSALSPDAVSNAARLLDQGYVGGSARWAPVEDNWKGRAFSALLSAWPKYIGPNGTPYIFAAREAYDRAGGAPVGRGSGQDVELLRRLKRIGEIAFDDDSLVFTSPRRYQEDGYLKYLFKGFAVFCGANFEWKAIRE
jgi:glycosyltransferase involved in cell wall biosynthesis